jgi:hypothetical protein
MTDSLSWESWEEWDEIQECFILYVVGEINTYNKSLRLALVKKNLPGISQSNLLLELVPVPSRAVKVDQELIYTEAIDKKRYDCVTIFLGHRVLAEINDIEKADRETESWNDESWDETI